MSQPTPTPAWGTPVSPTGTSPAAETQVLPPVTPVMAPAQPAQRVTKEMVELRVTAVHYAQKILGEQPTAGPDVAVANVLRQAKLLEAYLLSGKTA